MKNPKLEKRLLGEIFAEPKIIDEVRQLLNDDVFSEPKYLAIYKSMCEVDNQGKQIDITTVYGELKKSGLIDMISVNDLSGIEHYTAANFVEHCKMLLELWMKRGLSVKMNNAQERIKQGEDIFEIISTLGEDIYEIENNIIIEKDRNLYDEVGSLLNKVEQKFLGKIPEGIKLKSFPSINTATGGIMSDDFIIIYGKEKSAKTTVTERIILDFAFQNIPVAMFPLEMSFDASAYKAISMECGIEYLKLRNPKGNGLQAHELQDLFKNIHKFSDTKIYIDDKTFDFDRIIGKLKVLKRKYNIGLGVIDYAGLIQAAMRFEAKRFELKHYSSRLKKLSKELQIPIILVSQANNEGKTSESIDLLRDCDFALLCCKPYHEGIETYNFGTKKVPRYYTFTEDDFLVTVERARFGRDKQNFVVGYSGTQFIERDFKVLYGDPII